MEVECSRRSVGGPGGRGWMSSSCPEKGGGRKVRDHARSTEPMEK